MLIDGDEALCCIAKMWVMQNLHFSHQKGNRTRFRGPEKTDRQQKAFLQIKPLNLLNIVEFGV